jgi:hypothetical protein
MRDHCARTTTLVMPGLDLGLYPGRRSRTRLGIHVRVRSESHGCFHRFAVVRLLNCAKPL